MAEFEGIFACAFAKYECICPQMIRLTQSESAHDKKEKDSSSQDDSTTTIKKEADAEPVTPQGTDRATSGKCFFYKNTVIDGLPCFKYTSIKINT